MATDEIVSPKMVLFFRSLLILSLLFAVSGGIYAEIVIQYMSEDWQNIYVWNGDRGFFQTIEEVKNTSNLLIISLVIALIALLGILLYCVIGMFFFHKRARFVNLLAGIILFPLTPLLGLTIMLPLEYLFYQASSIC
jgi:hypothetical protein